MIAKLIAWAIRFAIGFAASFWIAFVFRKMWMWFVEPSFGIHTPTFWSTCGLICMTKLVRFRFPGPADIAAKQAKKEEWWEPHLLAALVAIGFCLVSALVLATGAFYHWMNIQSALAGE
jgi:hypothetical protein